MSAPYIQPTSTVPLPHGLNLAQFIQTVIVGISGLPGPMVRPQWQPEPPEQPDIDVNWIGMGINTSTPDANAYVDTLPGGAVTSQRHELLEVGLSIYGPDATDVYALVRDGFQIPANLSALFQATMGFVEVTAERHLPDLINERWFDRVLTTVFLRREVQRIYPIPTILSASGTIHTVVGDEPYLLDWAA